MDNHNGDENNQGECIVGRTDLVGLFSVKWGDTGLL